MNTLLYDFLMQQLPVARKRSAGGWISFNGPCCVHNGETRPDTRKRAGIRMSEEGSTVYHCFNCSFTCSWTPGQQLSKRMRSLLDWFGADQAQVTKLNYKAWQIKENAAVIVQKEQLKFIPMALPSDARKFDYWLNLDDIPFEFLKVAEYLATRGEEVVEKYEYYWSPNKKDNLNKRIIIPFYWQGTLVGYTARAIFPTKYRYLNTSQSHYIFNDSAVKEDNEYLLVVEGPFDALSIDGVAMLRNDCSAEQIEWINNTGKKIIVIPDFDKKKSNLLDVAERQGWYISFPKWDDEIKDANDAVKKYGKLYTIWSIIEYRTDSKYTINFNRTKYHI